MPEFLRGLTLELKDEAIEVLVFRWRELQALETVWAELSQDFQGEDAVLPQLRAQAADTAARLRTVAKRLGVTRRLVDATTPCSSSTAPTSTRPFSSSA